jgi:RHS repeat-associated protein
MPETAQPEAAGIAQEQATGAPSISLPKGGGALRGIGERFSANPATGTASFSVPVVTPSGRSDFGPKLSLSYDSGWGNGPFGFGWQMSTSSISRRTDRGVPRYEDALGSDTFVLAEAGELVPSAAAPVERLGYRVERFRPRFERDFTRIERWTRLADGDVHWRTISRDNVLSVYGLDASSRVCDPDDPRHVFSWLICHTYDDKGNAIVYEYLGEDSEGVDLSAAGEQSRARGAVRYLKRIRYGNRVPLLIDPGAASFRRPHTAVPDLSTADWMFGLVLDYGEGHYAEQAPDAEGRVLATATVNAPPGAVWPARADAFSSYRPGFELRMHRLCRRVLVFHHFPDELSTPDCLTWSTELEYVEKPFGSFVTRIVQSGYRRHQDSRYLKRSLPPLDLGYSQSPLEDPAYEGQDVQELDPDSLDNLSPVVDAHHRWVDLDGEGIAGMLSEEGGGWYYKPNLGDGRLGPAQLLDTRPLLDDGGRQVALDLAGDGTLDFVWLAGPAPGFNARTDDGGFEEFVPFESYPTLDWRDPSARLVDVVGDGLADMLVLDGECLYWHRSLGAAGFDEALRVELPRDEDHGPRVVFADRIQSIFVADMSGDGLADIVRITDGEVCYWPNLGYGRFGRKVTMDDAPVLEPPELFDPRRVRLADTDGSGTADLIYLGSDAVRVYLNGCGNGWSDVRVLSDAPATGGATSVTVGDLLGHGTACLIWSSALPADAAEPVRYLDLMGGVKPHLLVEVRNNLGAETCVTYSTSTSFYLADKQAGTPWVTRLPFPVHVVERIDTLDHVGRNCYVTRYRYHHGYFDGTEREFRGFGRVEQLDTDELAALSGSDDFPDAANVDAASYVPPVMTKMWFHTGAPGSLSHEYFGVQRTAVSLPAGLPAEDERQGRRALTGVPLRVETFGVDGTPAAATPYSVREQGWTVSVVEPGVYQPRAVEEIEVTLDRERPADARIRHRLTLGFDAFGNPLAAASVGYGRAPAAPADPLLTADDVARQTKTHVTYTVFSYTGEVALDDARRTPLEAERSTFELVNAAPAATLFTATELAGLVAAAGDGAHDLPADDVEGARAAGPGPWRRPIERVRTYYRADDLTAALSLGGLEPLALPDVTHRLAFTPRLAASLYVDSGKLTPAELDATLTNAGGYIHSDADPGWWLSSERIHYSPGDGDTAAQELAVATAHFFQPRRYVDATGAVTRTDHDAHDLMLVERRDALGNSLRATNDYRVLQPVSMTDPNGNRSAVVHDVLGRVAGTAVMGKEGGAEEGDSLEGFDPDPPAAAVSAHLADPLASAVPLLGRATTRSIVAHDLNPPVESTISRETHDAALGPGQTTRVQVRLDYSDGLARKIQVKRFAGPSGWLTDGWAVLDNKGRPVRQYEPFFDDDPAFIFAFTAGVSPIALRDPLGRIAAIVEPNRSWEKTIADPWRTEVWDLNDTVLLDPASDPDVGSYMHRLPDAAYLPTWHTERAGGGLGPSEQRAASLAGVHAGTPTVSFFDALGHSFLTVGYNRRLRSTDQPGTTPVEEHIRGEIRYDVEGRPRELVDAVGRVTARYGYDMLGNRVTTTTMDGGQRWMLLDVRSSQIRAWDSRGHVFTTTHDALRRVLTRTVRGTDAAQSDPRTLAQEVTYERLEYGESVPGGEADNLLTRLVQVRDGAGVLTTDSYEFKGLCLRRAQQLLADGDQLADWAGSPALEPDVWSTEMAYDALDRVTSRTTADGTVTTLSYDELSRVVGIEAQLPGAAAANPFVSSVQYDAHGSRTRIDYGNGARTDYEYDRLTGRLATQRTTRPAAGDAFAGRVFDNPTTVQDLSHAYDPMGNLVAIADAALRTVVGGGQPVKAEVLNEYDATYRLIGSSAREQSDPSDVEALRRYVESYDHDLAGNLTSMRHSAPGGTSERTYEYAEPSLLEPAQMSNRLTRAPLGGEVVPAFTYDAHGCITTMPHLPSMTWNFKDHLVATSRQVAAQPETTTYAYDATGLRLRKVVRRQNGTRRSERLYLSDVEIYREFGADGTTVSLRRDSLNVMDDRRRIALVEGAPGDEPVQRYQFADAIESARVELDVAGAVISYEEFTPFGTTAVLGGRAAAEVSLKRYRFTGRERDEETQLCHHGVRYYAPWLGRWTSCDAEAFVLPKGDRLPSGREPPHGWNPYAYARDNPYRYLDPTGRSDMAWVSAAVIAAPLVALLGVSLGLDIAGVPVPGTRPGEKAHWTNIMEGALFDVWSLGHYALPALMAAVTAWALGRYTQLSPEEIYVIAGMVGATWAYTYEMWERQWFAWMYQKGRQGVPILRNLTGVTGEAALEFRVNTMEDIVLGAVASWSLAALVLWWQGKPANLAFTVAWGTQMTLISFALGYDLVYGGHIATHDTHGYDRQRDYFYRLERGPEVRDPTVWGS